MLSFQLSFGPLYRVGQNLTNILPKKHIFVLFDLLCNCRQVGDLLFDLFFEDENSKIKRPCLNLQDTQSLFEVPTSNKHPQHNTDVIRLNQDLMLENRELSIYQLQIYLIKLLSIFENFAIC